MGLTSIATVVVAVLLTLVVFAAAVVLPPRWVGRWWSPIARGGLVLLVALLVLVSVALGLNRQNGWYTSWAELFGQRGHLTTSAAGAPPAAAAAGPTATPTPRTSSVAPLPRPGERRQVYAVFGARSGAHGRVIVHLPESYASSPQRRYPVLLALHGYPGTPSSWETPMNLPAQVDAAVASGALAETIVVMPAVNDPVADDGECVDGVPDRPGLETWLAHDVPAWAHDHLRVAAGRGSWAVAGYSAGGWCSTMLAVRHPDLVAAGISLSGYVAPDLPGGAPWAEDSAEARRYDLTGIVASAPPSVALWMQLGHADRFRPAIDAFLAAVRAPTSVTVIRDDVSGHRWDVWRDHLPAALAWLGGHVAGFAPVSGDTRA